MDRVHPPKHGWQAERRNAAGLRALSLGNRLVGRQLYSLAVAAVAFLIGGAIGLVVFFVAALVGRGLHELVNYVQHYGLVRVSGQRIAARHTWNCHRLVSNALQYNLPCHSAHHLAGRRPFWELRPQRNTPILPYGYQTMAAIALIPPLWRRIMTPLLVDWDERFSSEAERVIIRQRGWA